MSATTTTPADEPTTGDPRGRRGVAAVIGAVVVVLAVAVLIIVLGYVPLPDYPSLADDPDPSIPGTIAYVDHDAGSCLLVVAASGGEPREVACEEAGGFDQTLAWTTDGLLVALVYGRDGSDVVVYHPDRGEIDRIVGHRPTADRPGPVPPVEAALRQRADLTRRADGTVLRTERTSDGRALLLARGPDGTSRELLSAEGPRDYELLSAQWSPDGEWILLADTAGRLLVVGEDGGDPRVLVSGERRRGWWTMTAAWHVPGVETYTVDLDELRGDQ